MDILEVIWGTLALIGAMTLFTGTIVAYSWAARLRDAWRAAQLLVKAYDNGEDRDGSVDWEDVDVAYELALRAVRNEYER